MAEEGLIIDVDWNISKAEAKQQKLNRALEASEQKAKSISKNIEDLNKNLEAEKQLHEDIKSKMDSQLQDAKQLETAIERIKGGEASLSEFVEFGSLKEAENSLTKIEQSYAKNEAALNKNYASQQRITRNIENQNAALNRQNATTADIKSKIILNRKEQNKFTQAFAKSEKSAQRLGNRIKRVVTSALLISVIAKAFTSLREEFGKLITETGTKTAELTAKLNGNLAVIGRTLYESARPAIEFILNLLVKITNLLAQGLSKILGKNINDMKKLAKETKKTGEEAKKTTANFDTLNVIDTSSGSSESEKGVGTDFSALESGISNEVALLMAILSGASLVLGVILAFTGVNIPLGIGLIAAGAIGLVAAVAANWDKLSPKIKNTILIITAIVSSALLVLGAIFAFTGVNIPLGIAFLLLGAAGLVTAAKTSWSSLSDKTKEVIGVITLIVSSALLVLGVILAFTGVAIGLGIAFIALGAAGLVAAAKLSWNSMSDKTKGVISLIMAIGGTLLLVIGILLCITGVGIPLGIALIALGAASLVGSVALNWNAIVDKVKSIASSIGKIFKSCWEGIKTGFKAMVNGIIWFANKWIDSLNLLLLPIRGLIFGIAKAFGSDIKFDNVKIPHIPKLATGAVIPGGKPFYAMLGDQPKGKTNIEAPEELIRQIVREETGGKELVIKATGNMSQLIRLLKLELDSESRRASVF